MRLLILLLVLLMSGAFNLSVGLTRAAAAETLAADTPCDGGCEDNECSPTCHDCMCSVGARLLSPHAPLVVCVAALIIEREAVPSSSRALTTTPPHAPPRSAVFHPPRA